MTIGNWCGCGRVGQILTVETFSVPNLHGRLDGRITRWSESIDEDSSYAFAIRVFHCRSLDIASRHFNEHAVIGAFMVCCVRALLRSWKWWARLIDANPEHKRLNFYARALLFFRRPPCRNKHGATRTTSATCSSRCARHARHVTQRYITSWHDTHDTYRDVTQQVEFGRMCVWRIGAWLQQPKRDCNGQRMLRVPLRLACRKPLWTDWLGSLPYHEYMNLN